MAKLYFRYGAMNSGKTTHLLQVAHNYEEKGMKVLILKSEIDTKGNNNIISRLGLSRKVDIIISKDEDLKVTLDEFRNSIDCILVDEVQFFKKFQIDDLFEISIVWNIPVICYGLRTDFSMNGFEGSERLLLIAHSIEELKTICRCGSKAMINARKVNGKFVFYGEQLVIDDKEDVKYEPLCGKCFVDERSSNRF